MKFSIESHDLCLLRTKLTSEAEDACSSYENRDHT